ncbi:Rho GTPase-activating protein 39 [Geodia barretti]|nr:Rho GTPase-activating protein 39 [Geodia barretti]
MDRGEWVEIIEPQSKDKMFANPSTGEILLQPPHGATVKPVSLNQWWELYDQSSDRNYYYNANTEDTVWERPTGDADIIPLSKIQSTPESSDDHDYQNLPTQNGHDPLTEDEQKSRKLSEVFAHSPLAMEVGGGDASFTYPTSHKQDTPSSPSSRHPANSSLLDGTSDSLGSVGVHSSTTRERARTTHNDTGMGSSINESPGSPRHHAHEERHTPTSLGSPHRVVVTPNSPFSEEEVFKQQSRSPSYPSSNLRSPYNDREAELMKSRTLDLPRDKRKAAGGVRKRLGSNPNPAPSPPTPPARPASMKRTKSKSKSPAHAPKNPPPPPPMHKTVSVDTALSDKSSSPSSIPIAPPLHLKHPMVGGAMLTAAGTPLEAFKDLETHRTGFFRKKVTIANMLAWTKDSIKRPMIITRDKQQKKEAVELFKNVQQYMGDRQGKTRVKELDKLALTICSKCWEKKGLRDELYIQLCRQTTGNYNPKSLERGWELFSIALAFYPPTIKFRSYLEGFLWKRVEPLPENKGCPVEVYAQYCHKRVEKMVQSGAKRGLKKPSLEEVNHAKSAPFHPPVFGASLDEVMELQGETHPHLPIPWVVTALCDVILALKGPQTEGIFRVPGDIDEVNALKLKVEKGDIPMESLKDPHVPASLLKLWFRELEEPLIPEEY